MTVEEMDRLLKAANQGRFDDVGYRELPIEFQKDGEWHLKGEKIHQAWAWKDGKAAVVEVAPALIASGSSAVVINALCQDLAADLAHDHL